MGFSLFLSRRGVRRGLPDEQYGHCCQPDRVAGQRPHHSRSQCSTSPQVSGSSASLVAWQSLGQKGRDFVATAPSREELGLFAGTPAADPIRVYVGLDSAGSVDERAQLAVREMERTGAFDRAVVAVIITTGTGWVDEDVAESLEFMYAGDTALVTMQYSYLPSWLSFMVDKSKATEAASALIGAVHAEWAAMPADSRPKLVLFGESLGSYGTETTFGDLESMAAGADGTLLVGPPFANPIWRQLVDGRDEGTPVWHPVYDDGETVLFVQNASELRSPTGQQEVPRVMYLQNSSDPVVWWNPQLVYQAPEWLDEPRGPTCRPTCPGTRGSRSGRQLSIWVSRPPCRQGTGTCTVPASRTHGQRSCAAELEHSGHGATQALLDSR